MIEAVAVVIKCPNPPKQMPKLRRQVQLHSLHQPDFPYLGEETALSHPIRMTCVPQAQKNSRPESLMPQKSTKVPKGCAYGQHLRRLGRHLVRHLSCRLVNGEIGRIRRRFYVVVFAFDSDVVS